MKSVVISLFLFGVTESMGGGIDSLKIDSVKSIVQSSSGVKRYSALMELVYQLYNNDNEVALRYATTAYELAMTIGDSTETVVVTRVMGQLHRVAGKNREAITFLRQALRLATAYKIEDEEMRIANSLGLAYMMTSKYDSSLINYFYALRMRMERKQQREIALILGNIALLYYKMGGLEEALMYNTRALAVLENVVAPDVHENILTNTALCYALSSDFVRADELLDQWEGEYLNKLSKKSTMNWLFAKGELLIRQEKFEQALIYFKESLQLAEEMGDGRFEVEGKNAVARCLYKLGQVSKAKEYLKWCEAKAIEHGSDLELSLTYWAMLPILKDERNVMALSDFQDRYFILREKLNDQKVFNRISVAKVEFEEQQNKLQIARQAEVISLNQRVINQQQVLNIVLVGLAVLMTGFIIVLYRFSKYQKNISLALDRKVIERTRELQENEGALLKSLAEQKALLRLVSSKIGASLSTFRGLWNLAAVENGRNSPINNDRFEIAALELMQVSGIVDRSSAMRSEVNDVSWTSVKSEREIQ
jgi:tetratricopeptide (TPR) repeat protein